MKKAILFILFIPIIVLAQKSVNVAFNDSIEVFNLYSKGAKVFNKQPDSANFFFKKALAIADKNKIVSFAAINTNLFLGLNAYNRSSYQEALTYFEKEKSLAITFNKPELIAQSYNNLANVYIDLGKQNISLKYYQQCLNLMESIGNKKGMASSNSNIGFAYKDLGKYDEAIKYFFTSLRLSDELNDRNLVAANYLQLGNIYLRKNDITPALDYLNKALIDYKNLGNKRSQSITYNLLSVAYDNLKQFDKAIFNLNESIKLARETNDIRTLAYNSQRLGEIYYNQNLDEKALESFKESLSAEKKLNLRRSIYGSYLGIGKSLLHQKKYKESESYLLEGLASAKENNASEGLKIAYRELFKLYQSTGESEKAIIYFANYDNLKDSLLNTNTFNKLSELKTQYETEKKQKQIELLGKQNKIQNLEILTGNLRIDRNELTIKKNQLEINNKNLDLGRKVNLIKQKELEAKGKGQQLNILSKENIIQKLSIVQKNTTLGIFGGIFITSLFLGGLFYNRYKLKQETKLQATVLQQQEMATKSILEAEEAERKRISGDLHDGIGQMFSAVKMNLSGIAEYLNFTDQQAQKNFEKTLLLVDESCKEVRAISHQMAPNVLLKAGLISAVRDFIDKIDNRKLKINLEIDGLKERLETNVETVLYRVVQETVNNVIKHSEASVLDIQFIKDSDGLSIMIEDNGKGFDASKINNFEGIGLKNMVKRIEYLKGTIDFDSSIGNGAVVSIWIPV